MASEVDLHAAIVVRELPSGGVYAHPVADPSLATRSTSVAAALAEQERFLTRLLEKAPASTIAGYSLPADATLIEVPVVLPRGDLPRRTALTEPVTVPCIIVPHEGAYWVQILPLEAFAYFETDEGLERAVIEATEQMARVRDLSASEVLAMLPAQRHSLHQLELSIAREDAEEAGARARARRQRVKTRERAGAEKLLTEVGTSLRVLHAKGRQPEVLGRETELDALQSLLAGPERLSVVVVGREMAGKSALVHGLVSRAVHGRGPDPLGGRMVIATSGAQLVAGQSGFGELEQRIVSVMQAAEQLDAVVFFDNLGDLLSGRPGTIEDMVSGMLPYITQDRVRVVGELTPEQVSHYEKMHVGFFAALSRVTLEPLDKTQTRPILEARIRHSKTYEPDRPSLSTDAIGPLLDLCDRYLAYEAFPGKALRLHDELRAIHEGAVTQTGEPKPLGPAEVYGAFSNRSGIPLFLLKEERAVKLEEIERFFARRVIGQREAVRRVAETVCMVKANLQPPGKPLANFLFIGPTGVGKTEVAKTLALFLFGGTERMVRFDMSEYMDARAAERLIRGTQRDEGELTKRVRQQPFCVVLLDEIEKAHPAVFDLLLQVCGEGRLSDARGRTTWFNNAIIIMTSNLGAAHRKPDAGFGTGGGDGPEAMATYYLEQVDKHFRPEFVGRIDRVIPFSSLLREEVSAVAEVALRKIVDRDGVLGRAASLVVSSAALEQLAEAGYSAAYGARALRRHLEAALVGPVSVVLAKHAGVLDGARVDVRWPDESTPEPREGFTTEAEELVGDLSITVTRPLAGRSRQTAHHLGTIAALRRVADRCLHCSLALELRERLDYIVADLAGARMGDTSETAGKLAAERGLLQGVLDGVTEHRDAIADAEELAMTAQLEGADAGLFVDEAREAYARFERAFVRMVAGHIGEDCITVFARSWGGGRTHDFLEVLDAAASQRGWDVTVHRAGDPEGDEGWPAGARYGPPRTLAWWRERRALETDKERAQWSSVLIRVRGSLAEELVEGEVGPWRFETDGGNVEVLELSVLRYDHEASFGELCPDPLPESDDDFAIPARRKPEELRREEPVRTWAKTGERWVVSTAAPAASFSIATFADYAAELERVQFASRAEKALATQEEG